MKLKSFSDQCQQRIAQTLEHILPSIETEPGQLHQAMRYCALAGGKRLRPQLVYAVGKLGRATDEALDACACAIELIHTYSLIHDDLPAMDDDDLRRGQPTCHRAFDEATAILAGDALQALAFRTLAIYGDFSADCRADLIAQLAQAAGSEGMVGGQSLDLANQGQNTDLAALKNIHAKKTGALIQCAVLMAQTVSLITDPVETQALAQYGTNIGLAFQIQDDILDVEGDPALMGKALGNDAQRELITFPQLIGLEEAKKLANALTEQAIQSLDPFGGSARMLREIAKFISQRHT